MHQPYRRQDQNARIKNELDGGKSFLFHHGFFEMEIFEDKQPYKRYDKIYDIHQYVDIQKVTLKNLFCIYHRDNKKQREGCKGKEQLKKRHKTI